MRRLVYKTVFYASFPLLMTVAAFLAWSPGYLPASEKSGLMLVGAALCLFAFAWRFSGREHKPRL